MSKTYTTSDSHYGHGNIVKYCQRIKFANEEEKKLILDIQNLPFDQKREKERSFRISNETIYRMNKALIDSTNEMIGADDTLIHVGDFCFGQPEQWLYIRSQINCKNIILCMGNHDKRVPKEIFSQVIPESVEFVYQYNGRTIVFNHYSLPKWTDSDKGSILLYGHHHGTLRENPNLLSMDVGVDCNNYKPHDLNSIIAYMDEKKKKIKV